MIERTMMMLVYDGEDYDDVYDGEDCDDAGL